MWIIMPILLRRTGMIEDAHFLNYELDYSRTRLLASLNNLTDDQAKWRPSPKSNSITSILFHIARQDDFTISIHLAPQTQLFISAGWADRMGLPKSADHAAAFAKTPDGSWPSELGWTFTSLEDPANKVTLKAILEYAEATRQMTKRLLETATPEMLGRPIEDGSPRHKGWDVAKHIGAFAMHESHHQGQIDYLKGLRVQLVPA